MGAIKMVEAVVGSARIEPPKDRITEDQARARANETWARTVPIAEEDPVGKYLASRHLWNRPWREIRYHPALHYAQDAPSAPAMVAMVRDAAGRPATLHRTYLRHDGAGKADIANPRRTSHGLSLPKGAAIRLAPVETGMGVGEGIETCMAASLLFSMPIWSALNAGNLSQFWPPDGVEAVTIFGDNDRNFVGQCAAYKLAERLAGKFAVTVKIPNTTGDDWADVLAAEALRE